MIRLLASSPGPSGGGVGKGMGSMKITFIPLTPSHMYLPCQWVTHLCPRTIPYWFKIKDSFMLLHTDPQIA